MSENTGKLRATIIRIKRTIDEVESEDTEDPADSLILEIPKKRARRFKDLSLNDKEEEEEEEEKEEKEGEGKGKKDKDPKEKEGKEEEEGVLERRVFKFVGSSREGNVENPLSLEDFKKVRSVLRKTMQAKAAERTAKEEQQQQSKKRTKQGADKPVNARVSFVSAKKSARVLDLTEGNGSDALCANGNDATEVVTCNGIPMKVTKRKKTVYDIYYCYERVKPKKGDRKTKSTKKGTDDDDDDDDEDDDDVEYEEAFDSEDDQDGVSSADKVLYEEAKRFRIDGYDSDLFFGNLDEYAVDEEEVGNDYDYDSNAEDNSANTYPDEDDFDSDSGGDPFGFDEDDDDDDDDSDSDDSSYTRWNNYGGDRNSELKKKFASDMFKIFGSHPNKKKSDRYADDYDDDDDDMMDFDDDDDDDYDNQYSKFAYDGYDDYKDGDDDDDDDNYF